MATAIWGMCLTTAQAIKVGCGIVSIPPVCGLWARDDMAAEGYGDYLNQVEDVT